MKKQIVFLQLLFAMAAWNAQATVVKGTVKSSDGKPVENVVVTDGYVFTTTNAKGEYSLDSNEAKSRFVYISTPSGYKIGTSEGWNHGFYQTINHAQENATYDFTLSKHEQPVKEFVYLAISDPQVTNEKELGRYTQETVADIKQTVAPYLKKKTEVHAAVLGDLVNDKMELFEPLRQSMASLGIIFSPVIGNHDHNQQYTTLSNLPDANHGYAEERYESFFGPYNYSFNVGNIHIITLKDIDYIKDRKYTERFGSEQLDWLKNDLKYVKPGSTVFINVHAPVFNQSQKGGNARDAEEFKQIVSAYNVHIFAGHTHYFENNAVSANLYEHNIGAACGAWWAGHVNRCGAPNGYLVVNVNGNDIKWHYKATGKPADYQFRVYKPGEFKSEAGYVVANIWDWDPAFRVEWSEDGTAKGVMEHFDSEDQDYIDMHGKPEGYHTLHLFRCQPSDDAKQIEIKVTNRFGETYKQTVAL